jgi:hypothetical protein
MALTIANSARQAALNGITALLNGGTFQLTDAAGGAGSELASLALNATAFGSGTSASPSVATSNAITADNSVTAGTILGFNLRSSAPANIISGNVGTSGADLNVTDNVIPGGATQVSCTGGLTLSLQLS